MNFSSVSANQKIAGGDSMNNYCSSDRDSISYQIGNNDEIIIFYDDGSFLRRVPAYLVDADPTASIIWKVVGGCSTVYYVSGHDARRILLDLLNTPREKVTYTLTGRYISGYWEYKVNTV